MTDTLTRWEAEAKDQIQQYELLHGVLKGEKTPTHLDQEHILTLISIVKKLRHDLRQVLTSAVLFHEIPKEQALHIEKTLEDVEKILQSETSDSVLGELK